MFVGRKDELQQLFEAYNSAHSNLIVLYGREGMGKTCLVKKFCENKGAVYYQAAPCTDREQLRRMAIIFGMSHTEDDITSDCYTMLKAYVSDSKRIIVIDEFQFMAAMLTTAITGLFSEEENSGKLMVVLISSSINWVENAMVQDMKPVAGYFTGLIKLKELSFSDMVDWFPGISTEDCITIRAVFGGVPKYLKLWQENRRVRENIISLMFNRESSLYHEAERLLKLELRELSSYNTILSALASDNIKLNDIYAYTGFGRAKISVYLKNLIQMDMVEKIYSYSNVKNMDNTQKGLYRIKDNFISFYYAYVFNNMTQIEDGRGKYVYDNVFLPNIENYMRSYFADVCREFLELMCKHNRLDYKYAEWRSWFGKTGRLDIVATDENRRTLAGLCSYSAEPLEEDTVDSIKELTEAAGINPSLYCVFARGGFSASFMRRAKQENIFAVAMNDL